MNSVQEFYTNPMDIAQFLDGEKAEMLMRNIIRKAAIFHSKTGISPIVKTEDHDIYSLDYFFLVHRLSEFAFEMFSESNIQLAEEIKERIVSDFGMDSEYKNKRLLINLLNYQSVLYSNNDKRWAYILKRYKGKYNNKLFLLSGVSIDGHFIKGQLTDSEREQLENIGDSKQFILESFGNKAMYLHESTSENLTVLTFS